MKKITLCLLFLFALTSANSQNVFPSSGNVGIGYASPGSPLTVVGSGNLVDFSNNTDQATFFYLSAPGASDKRSLISTSTAGRLSLGAGGANEYLTIVNSGKIGIGTTSPAEKLHVAGSSVNGAVVTLIENTDASTNSFASLQFKSGISANYWQAFARNGNFFIGIAGIADYMMIKSDGKVGIGTSSPDEKLTVNGAVHATRVKVETTVPGPDYVFEKSYSLPTLDEVKSYIDENKHLPEVPSAKEMEVKGIDVGEMNMLLLKKVEELTLYVIEQNKKIEDLADDNKKNGVLIESLLKK